MSIGGEAGYYAYKYKMFGPARFINLIFFNINVFVFIFRYKISAFAYIMKGLGLKCSIDIDDINIVDN